jgi:hypothetical protein
MVRVTEFDRIDACQSIGCKRCAAHRAPRGATDLRKLHEKPGTKGDCTKDAQKARFASIVDEPRTFTREYIIHAIAHSAHDCPAKPRGLCTFGKRERFQIYEIGLGREAKRPLRLPSRHDQRRLDNPRVCFPHNSGHEHASIGPANFTHEMVTARDTPSVQRAGSPHEYDKIRLRKWPVRAP